MFSVIRLALIADNHNDELMRIQLQPTSDFTT